jgi:hypothetical protein
MYPSWHESETRALDDAKEEKSGDAATDASVVVSALGA